MFRDNKTYTLRMQTNYDVLGSITSSSIEEGNRRHYLYDRTDYKNIMSVINIHERTKGSSIALAARFEITYCQYLLDLLVSGGMLEHEKMVFFRENLSKISNNDALRNYMNKILIACGQETDFDRTFSRKTTYDSADNITKISCIGLPVSFKQPTPDEYKAYASSCNFFARRHKIDAGSGFILLSPLLNIICGYLAYYNEIISAITPGYCNLQPGFLLAWNNNHCDSKDAERTDKSAFRK